jgi:hypothetical protein
MKRNWILVLCMAAALAGCSKDEPAREPGIFSFTTSVEGFEGEQTTRVGFEGNAFENGDKIKLKIICPFSSHTEFGETTYGASFDAFWLLKWKDDGWATITSADGYDINGDYSPSSSPNVYDRFEAQQTPYVYTAQTWSEEQIFIAGSGTRVEQYSNVFHADQTKEAAYKASDLLWAQAIQQTGSYNVHLSFRHVMSALLVTIDDSNGISDDAVLTLEGMPRIDQCEVVVGDYYAARSKVNSNDYGYRSKHSCSKDDNGKVIGVAVVDDAQRKTVTKPLNEIAQTATYKAYNTGTKSYRLIVPPCTLASNATFWLRDGERRYSMQLDQTLFEPGKLYRIVMQVK